MLKNTFKLSLASIMAFSLSSVFADEIQDEINRLKKENELLELKQQNEALKNNKQSKAPKAKSQVDKSGAFGFCKGQNEHTGCFIGLETGWRSGWHSYDIGDGSFAKTTNTNGIPINLQLGWQWYYALNQGLKIQAYGGYGYFSNKLMNTPLNSHTIQYGLEAQWLYDFLYTEKHTFGADLGIGFEGITIKSNLDNFGFTNFYTKFSSTYRIGLHYYAGEHHQFLLNYKYSLYNIGEEYNLKNSAGGTEGNMTLTPNNSINIAYQYKF